MTTIKSYTDIEQSKKLAEILPLESADMWYDNDGESIAGRPEVRCCSFVGLASINIPCWSLAALINVLNTIDDWYPGIDAQVGKENYWQICMFSYNTGSDENKYAIEKELVDCCYEVIIKCKEQKLL